MAENVGSGESEFGSVTSSQVSFLNNCPFAHPHGGVEEDTDSDTTEVLVTPISQPLTRTPILSLSTPISLDSINDEDVFHTPLENASLSSAAESEPRARASEIKPRRGGGGEGTSKSKSKSKSKSPSPVSASHHLTPETARVSDLDSSSPPSATEGIKVTDDDYEIEIPFKEVIEALVRNSGENLDERVSYIDILKQFGLKFP